MWPQRAAAGLVSSLGSLSTSLRGTRAVRMSRGMNLKGKVVKTATKMACMYGIQWMCYM